MRAMMGLMVWICAVCVSAQESLYAPTEYAFVSGSAIPNIAVVDIHEGKQVDTLRIPVPARVFAASTDSPYLAISDTVDYALYVINLETREITRHETPSAVYRIVFIPFSTRLAVVLEERVGMLDYRSGKLEIADKHFQNLYTRFNTIFSVYSETFWVTQENTSLIYRYRLDQPEVGWETLDIGDTRGFGQGAPSYEDQIIAFNTYYADEGIIYFNDTGKILSTGPMYNSRPLNESMVEPYVDNSLRHVIFGDKRGLLKIYQLEQSEEPITFQVSFPPDQFKTGWLDRYLIVGGDEHLGIYPFDNLENGVVYEFGYEEDVADMWVSGDSKLLLFGTRRSNMLSRYNLQKGERLPEIPLSGIAEVGKIRMNTTNTVCY